MEGKTVIDLTQSFNIFDKKQKHYGLGAGDIQG